MPKDELQPLQLGDQSLKGTIDVLILGLDEANSAGRKTHNIPFRLFIDVRFDDQGRVSKGSVTAHSYLAGDFEYGKNVPRTQHKISGGWDKQAWTAGKQAALAAGTDWPSAHGPDLTVSAAPFEGEFVNNLHDARIQWVAEDVLPSGRSGGRSRGGFGMAAL